VQLHISLIKRREKDVHVDTKKHRVRIQGGYFRIDSSIGIPPRHALVTDSYDINLTFALLDKAGHKWCTGPVLNYKLGPAGTINA
jgi:hypothetical protein